MSLDGTVSLEKLGILAIVYEVRNTSEAKILEQNVGPGSQRNVL
jgi:hypothetical protein